MKNIKTYKAASLFLALCFGLGLVAQSTLEAYGSDPEGQEKPKQTGQDTKDQTQQPPNQVSASLEAVAPTPPAYLSPTGFMLAQTMGAAPARLLLFPASEKRMGKFLKTLLHHLKAANAP